MADLAELDDLYAGILSLRGDEFKLPCSSLLKRSMNTFSAVDGPAFQGYQGPDVQGREHGYRFVQIKRGHLTSNTLRELKWFMEEYIDSSSRICGLTFIGCIFKGEAVMYFATHFPYIKLTHLEIINCLSEEVDAVSVFNADQHYMLEDSVRGFYMRGTKGCWPPKALSSIVSTFVEHNTALREVSLSHTEEKTISTTAGVLQGLLDRCNGRYKSPELDLKIDVGEKRQAELLRDLLGHKHGPIRCLYLGCNSTHTDGLPIMLSGIATNNGVLKELLLSMMPFEVSDWKVLAASVKSNKNKLFKLRKLYTGQFIGTATEGLITEVNVAFKRQDTIDKIITPGMEQLRFLQHKARIKRWMRVHLGDHEDDDTKSESFMDNFYGNDLAIQDVILDPIYQWRDEHSYEEKKMVEAECLSGIYYALRTGAGINQYRHLEPPRHVPDATTTQVGDVEATEPPIKKRKLP